MSNSYIRIFNDVWRLLSDILFWNFLYKWNIDILILNFILLSDAIINIDREIDKPNSRYDPTYIGTWSSISDVDVFCNRFNHSNNYKDGDTKIGLGDYVTIQDGTYNSIWMVAGFDMESNQIAADDTVYDNGYGICLIPQTQVTTATWNANETLIGAYKSSTMHNTHLPNIVSKLQTILGSHIVTRNVLLSNSVDGNYYSNSYTWTTAKATLMSIGQMNGSFAANRNKYDDGEADYKLPIFNSKDFKTGYNFWSRGVCDDYGPNRYAWYVNGDGSVNYYNVNYASGVRPLIYLR